VHYEQTVLGLTGVPQAARGDQPEREGHRRVGGREEGLQQQVVAPVLYGRSPRRSHHYGHLTKLIDPTRYGHLTEGTAPCHSLVSTLPGMVTTPN